MKKWLSLLIITVAVVYRDSFFSPFFQDDKILLNLSFGPTANFPYRPVSQALFYTVSRSLFGLNPFYFHLVLFAFITGTVFIVFALAKNLLQNENKAILATAFYALNVSLFPLFYWVATSYFSIGAFFFFLTIFFFIKRKTWATTVAYLLALGSNEIAFVLPLIFIFLGWRRSTWFYLGTLPVLLFARLALGLPQAADYSLSFDFLPTVRWYLFRALNLPEGVKRSSPEIFAFFATLLSLLTFSFFKNSKINWKIVKFGALFFFLAALPFFFLPNHSSAYYLTMALFGPALIFGEIVTGKKLTILLLVCYFILTVLGLQFLAQTHWIILKNTGPIGKF